MAGGPAGDDPNSVRPVQGLSHCSGIETKHTIAAIKVKCQQEPRCYLSYQFIPKSPEQWGEIILLARYEQTGNPLLRVPGQKQRPDAKAS